MYSSKMEFIICFCFCMILPAFGIGEKVEDPAKHVTGRTGRAGYFDNLDNRLPYNPDYQNEFHDSSSTYPKFSSSLDSSKTARYDVPIGFDQFVPDESDSDEYSYAPGGFYLPSSKKNKLNYFVEEVTDRDNSQSSSSLPKEGPSKEMAIKGMKVLTDSENIETEVMQRPNFLSYFRKLLSNPMVIFTVLMVPLTFLAEMIFPYLLKMFGDNMMPAITSTIASGFARSLNGDASLHAEQILDVINEYGARALEDPRCFQRFLCQGVKSGFESRTGDTWSIPKVIRKLTNTVDDRLWSALGLKQLFNSVQSGSCDSLVCTGTSAYTQDVPLIKKLRLLGAKIFSHTEMVH